MNATPANKLGWTIVGQTAAVAQAASYNMYVDGATTATALSGVVCVAAGSDASCSVPFPAFTPGNHSITLTQMISGVESGKSLPLAFTFVLVVTPTNLVIT